MVLLPCSGCCGGDACCIECNKATKLQSKQYSHSTAHTAQPPTISVSGGGGNGATFTPSLSTSGSPAVWSVASIAAAGGSGYIDGAPLTITAANTDTVISKAVATVIARSAPTLTLSGGGGVGATFSPTLTSSGTPPVWTLASATASGGSGYVDGAALTITAANGDVTTTKATATVIARSQPTITATAPGGSGASLAVTLSQSGSPPTWAVSGVSVLAGGTGYTNGAPVTFSAGAATTVTAPTAVISTGGGQPSHTIDASGAGGTGAAFSITYGMWETDSIYEGWWYIEIAVTNGGSGYSEGGTVLLQANAGTQNIDDAATPHADFELGYTVAGGVITSVSLDAANAFKSDAGSIQSVTVTNGGSVYVPGGAASGVTVTGGGQYHYPYGPALAVTVADGGKYDSQRCAGTAYGTTTINKPAGALASVWVLVTGTANNDLAINGQAVQGGCNFGQITIEHKFLLTQSSFTIAAILNYGGTTQEIAYDLTVSFFDAEPSLPSQCGCLLLSEEECSARSGVWHKTKTCSQVPCLDNCYGTGVPSVCRLPPPVTEAGACSLPGGPCNEPKKLTVTISGVVNDTRPWIGGGVEGTLAVVGPEPDGAAIADAINNTFVFPSGRPLTITDANGQTSVIQVDCWQPGIHNAIVLALGGGVTVTIAASAEWNTFGDGVRILGFSVDVNYREGSGGYPLYPEQITRSQVVAFIDTPPVDATTPCACVKYYDCTASGSSGMANGPETTTLPWWFWLQGRFVDFSNATLTFSLS